MCQGKSFPGREEAVQKTVRRREHLGIFKEKQRDNEAGLSKGGGEGEMKLERKARARAPRALSPPPRPHPASEEKPRAGVWQRSGVWLFPL